MLETSESEEPNFSVVPDSMETSSTASTFDSPTPSAPAATTGEQILQEADEVNQLLSIFLDSRFLEAETKATASPHRNSIYYSVGLGFIYFMKSLFTFDIADIEQTQQYLSQTIHISQKLKDSKESFYARIARFLSFRRSAVKAGDERSTQEDLSIIGRHADIVMAEAYLLQAVISICTDTNAGWMLMLRESIHVRSSYLVYHTLLRELLARDKGVPFDPHAESAILLGNGVFNIMFPLMPPRVFQAFSLFGYSGSISQGIAQLRAGGRIKDGLRSRLCNLALLFFYTFVGPFFGRHEIDWPTVNEVLDISLKDQPNSIILLYIKSRAAFMQRDMVLAMAIHSRIGAMDSLDWPQMRHGSLWELVTCYLYQLDWRRGYECAKILSEENRWSKAYSTYLQAIFLHSMQTAENPLTAEISDKVRALLERIPTLQKRIGGRSLPIEKFAGQRAVSVIAGKQSLHFPLFELVLVWDGFKFYSEENLTKINADFEKALAVEQQAPKPKGQAAHQIAQLLLSLAAILRARRDFAGATIMIDEVLAMRACLPKDSYAIPIAHIELAQINMLAGSTDLAKHEMEKAAAIKHKYVLYKSIQLRISACRVKLDQVVQSAKESTAIKVSLDELESGGIIL